MCCSSDFVVTVFHRGCSSSLVLSVVGYCSLSSLPIALLLLHPEGSRERVISRSFCGLSSSGIRLQSGSTNQGSLGWNKKRKMANPVWRPVITSGSSSNAGGLVNGEGYEARVVDVTSTTQQDSSTELLETTLTSHSVHTDQEPVDNVKTLVETTSPFNLQSRLVAEGTGRPSACTAASHSTSLEVGASLLRLVKGKGGVMRKRIEEEFGVKLNFHASKGNSIAIEGNSVESISKAAKEVEVVIDKAVKSPNLDYSHFISLPLAIHHDLVDKLARFQNSILYGDDIQEDFRETVFYASSEETSDDNRPGQQLEGANVAVNLQVQYGNNPVKVDLTSIPITSFKSNRSKIRSASDLGIDKSIFIKPKTFHLTVLMLKLWNQERIEAATEVLRNVSSRVHDALESRPVAVRLKGLDCMKGSLSKAHVLYCPVEEVGDSGRLVRACQVMIDAFVEAGLVLEKDARQKLKLHATVMNARHRKRKRWMKKNDWFDARGIHEQYGSKFWGEYNIREAHLSERFVYDDNGYYHCCASIPFPENMHTD